MEARAKAAAVAAAAATAGCLAGCGGAAAVQRGGGATAGQAVFVQECSACHSLTGRTDPRLQGGDLLGLHTSRANLLEFAREMPVVHRPLTGAQLQAVVTYVQSVQNAADRR